MKKFKHSGSTGDLIYSLALMKHFGGGELYLHLDQINWIGKHYYYVSTPDPFHQNHMNQQDWEFMREFMLAQDYIKDFRILDNKTEITHNLDRFRPLFVGHPGNYVDIYCTAFGIHDPNTQKTIRTNPWLTVPNPKVIDNRTWVINRTERWIPRQLSTKWNEWREDGAEERSIFVGLPKEYEIFKNTIGWDIPFQSTENQLELASIIAGSQMFIGNQSQALALAIGLGKAFWCEARQDLPMERNECYFPNQPNGNYF